MKRIVLLAMLAGLLCGCQSKQVAVLFAKPDGTLLTSERVIVVRRVWMVFPPLKPRDLFIIGMGLFSSFRDPPWLRLCSNESEAYNETGALIDQDHAGDIYAFTVDNGSPLACAWVPFPERTTVVPLVSLSSTDKEALQARKIWAHLLGTVIFSESDLLSPEEISELRRHITPTVEKEFFEQVMGNSPESIEARAKAFGVEVR